MGAFDALGNSIVAGVVLRQPRSCRYDWREF